MGTWLFKEEAKQAGSKRDAMTRLACGELVPRVRTTNAHQVKYGALLSRRSRAGFLTFLPFLVIFPHD